MVLKRSIQILGAIIVLIILVCILTNFYINSTVYSKNQLQSIKPGFGVVSNSEFELISEWYQKSVSNYTSYFNFNRSTGNFIVLMAVSQYPTKLDYDGSYTDTGKKTPDWSASAGTEIIGNVNVKKIEITRHNDAETTMYYFFEKNNKYYQIFIDIAGYGTLQYSNDNKGLINKTVSTIINTIH
jgi:hypothetical protein